MKTIQLFLVLSLLIASVSTKAQLSINVNIGSPPVWAPRAPAQVQYYYLPDIEVYYDVPARRYIYMKNGNWFRSSSLPARYRGYDLYHGNTVYLSDYHGRKPFENYEQHRMQYKGNGNWNNNGHDNGNRRNTNHHEDDHRRENDNGHRQEKEHGRDNEKEHGRGHDH